MFQHLRETIKKNATKLRNFGTQKFTYVIFMVSNLQVQHQRDYLKLSEKSVILSKETSLKVAFEVQELENQSVTEKNMEFFCSVCDYKF